MDWYVKASQRKYFALDYVDKTGTSIHKGVFFDSLELAKKYVSQALPGLNVKITETKKWNIYYSKSLFGDEEREHGEEEGLTSEEAIEKFKAKYPKFTVTRATLQGVKITPSERLDSRGRPVGQNWISPKEDRKVHGQD